MFYKVLTEIIGNRLVSANHGSHNQINYNRTGINYAPLRTKLFVFADRLEAVKWANSFSKTKPVFECDAIGIEKIQYVPHPTMADDFWVHMNTSRINRVTNSEIFFLDGYSVDVVGGAHEMLSTYLVSALVLGKQIH